MTTRVMNAEARITAVDRTGNVLAGVANKMRSLARTSAAVNAQVGRTGRLATVAASAQARAAGATSAAVVAAGRYLAPVAAGYAATQAVKNFATVERQMTRVGITADASREEMRGFSAEARQMGAALALPYQEIVKGADALAAQGRSLKDIKSLLPAVAKTAQASGAEVADIAKSADAVGTHLKVSAGEMQKAFDIMAEGGKAGQFELKDMARYLPSLAPAAKALGIEGTNGLAQLVAMLQVIRKGAGTTEEAAGSMNNILQKMDSDETRKRFKEQGVDLEEVFKKARKEGKNLLQVFEDATWQAIKGDLSQIPRVINDMEFARGMRAILAMRGSWQDMAKTIARASGTVDRDVKRVLDDTEASLQRLSNAWDLAWARVGETLVKVGAASGLENIAEGLANVNREFDRMNSGERTNTEKLVNSDMNWLRTGQWVDQPAEDLAKARREWFDRALLDVRRSQISQQIESERGRAAVEARNWGTTSAVGRGRQAAIGANIAKLEGQLKDLNDSVAARDEVAVRIAAVEGARRSIGRRRINDVGALNGEIGGAGMGRFGLSGPDGSRFQTWGAPAVAHPEPPIRPSDLRSAMDGLTAEVKPDQVTATIDGTIGGTITIKVDGPGQVTGSTVRGTGHAAGVGTSMIGAKYNIRNEGGR